MTDLLLYPIITAGIVLLTQFIKGYIEPKYGKTGIQLFIILLSFLVGGFWVAKEFLSPEILKTIVIFWVAANGSYQVFFKPVFEKLGLSEE